MQTEINNKKSRLRTLKNEFNLSRNDLQFSLNCIDFAHISVNFFSSNDNHLKSHDSIEQNFSNISLMEAEILLLVNSFSFSFPPKKLSYSDYLVNFELFYRTFDNLQILSGDNLDYST